MVVSHRGHRSKSAGVGARGETGTTEATIATAAAAATTTAGYILCEAIVERRKEVHCCVIQLIVVTCTKNKVVGPIFLCMAIIRR